MLTCVCKYESIHLVLHFGLHMYTGIGNLISASSCCRFYSCSCSFIWWLFKSFILYGVYMCMLSLDVHCSCHSFGQFALHSLCVLSLLHVHIWLSKAILLLRLCHWCWLAHCSIHFPYWVVHVCDIEPYCYLWHSCSLLCTWPAHMCFDGSVVFSEICSIFIAVFAIVHLDLFLYTLFQLVLLVHSLPASLVYYICYFLNVAVLFYSLGGILFAHHLHCAVPLLHSFDCCNWVFGCSLLSSFLDRFRICLCNFNRHLALWHSRRCLWIFIGYIITIVARQCTQAWTAATRYSMGTSSL